MDPGLGRWFRAYGPAIYRGAQFVANHPREALAAARTAHRVAEEVRPYVHAGVQYAADGVRRLRSNSTAVDSEPPRTRRRLNTSVQEGPPLGTTSYRSDLPAAPSGRSVALRMPLSSARRYRRRRRRPFRLRRRFARGSIRRSSMYRATYPSRVTAGNGRRLIVPRRGGKAYPRTVGRGLNQRLYKFTDTAYSVYGTNLDGGNPSILDHTITEFAPSGPVTWTAQVIPLTYIVRGTSQDLHHRQSDRLIVKRMDMSFDLTLGENAQSGMARIWILWDKFPTTNSTYVVPTISDILETNMAAYPPVPNPSGMLGNCLYSRWVDVCAGPKVDLNSYIRPDRRNRYEVLYSEIVKLERGASHGNVSRAVDPAAGTEWHLYAGGMNSSKNVTKTLYLNRVQTYLEGDTGGSPASMQTGALWLLYQSTNVRYAPAENNAPLDTEVRIDMAKFRTFFVDIE